VIEKTGYRVNYMYKKHFIVLMLVVAVSCLPACSGNKIKNGAQQLKPAPAAGEQMRGDTGSGEQKPGGPNSANPASAVAPIPVKKRIPAELLAAVPCKLESMAGVFAVFPDNPAAGQTCFGIYPVRKNTSDIPKFDIQGGGMHIIFHYTAGNEPGATKLMKWEERGGKPCLEASCGKEIAVRRETYSAPGESGWAYIIITPEKPLDFASVSGGYYGLVMGADKYIPLFQ
jgi:hypothetical protein